MELLGWSCLSGVAWVDAQEVHEWSCLGGGA